MVEEIYSDVNVCYVVGVIIIDLRWYVDKVVRIGYVMVNGYMWLLWCFFLLVMGYVMLWYVILNGWVCVVMVIGCLMI